MIHDLQTHLTASTAETHESIEAHCAIILSTLGRNYDDFSRASEMYNSTFFKDESEEFKVALCTALYEHFSQKTNTYWNKIVETAGSGY